MNETNTTALPIHITPHHLTLSPALRDFAQKKLAKVPRFASDVLAADIVLRRHHGTADGKRFSASARLALAGRDIHATAAHADLYTAIVKLVARLARRSRKRKTRLGKTHSPRPRRTARRTARDAAVTTHMRGETRHPRQCNGGRSNAYSASDAQRRLPSTKCNARKRSNTLSE